MACSPIAEQSALNARRRRVGSKRSCEAVWRRQARKQAGIHGGAEAPRQSHTRSSQGRAARSRSSAPFSVFKTSVFIS